MTKNEILQIVEKYRSMSKQEYKYGADKCALFDRIADQLDNNIEIYADDDYYESEKDIIDDIKEVFDEIDNYFDDEDLENEFE